MIKELSRSGWGVIWLSEFGRVLARLYGPLGAFYPQTSVAAEFAAPASASSLLSANSGFYSDCQVVVDAFGKPPRDRLHPNRPHAGLVMQWHSPRDFFGAL